MSEIRRILVHIDHEEDNRAVLARTLQLASVTQATVELYCSAYNTSLHQSYLLDKKAEQHAEHGFVKQVEAQLEKYANELTVKGVHCGYDVYWERHSVDGLIRKVLRYQPDLLIYPVPGDLQIGELLSGDTEGRLIRECPVPLLLTHGKPWKSPPRIAACVDPFHISDDPVTLDHAVLDATRDLCAQVGGAMEVVHSYHTLPHSAIFDEHVVTDYEALQSQVRDEHRRVLNELLEPYGINMDSGAVKIIEGVTHKALPVYAQQEEVDLLVVGQQEKSVLDRLLTGSTVARVQHHLVCDLLVVKPAGFVCPVEA